jgi:hypothetical protein
LNRSFYDEAGLVGGFFLEQVHMKTMVLFLMLCRGIILIFLLGLASG